MVDVHALILESLREEWPRGGPEIRLPYTGMRAADHRPGDNGIRGVSVVTSTDALQWKGLQNDLLMDETMRVITLKWLMLNFKPAWPGEDSDLQSSWFVVNRHIILFLIEIINRFLCTQWNFTHTCSGPYSLAFLSNPDSVLGRNLKPHHYETLTSSQVKPLAVAGNHH